MESRWWGLAESVLLETPVELGASQAQDAGRLTLVALGLCQRLLEEPPLRRVEVQVLAVGFGEARPVRLAHRPDAEHRGRAVRLRRTRERRRQVIPRDETSVTQ